MRPPLLLVPLLAACGSTDTTADAIAGYGPYCVPSYEPPVACDCALALDWSGVTPNPVQVDAIVVAGPAIATAAATCTGTLTEDSELQAWRWGALRVDEGGDTVDLSPYAGDTLYVAAVTASGGIATWGYWDIAGEGAASVTVQ